MRQAFHASTHLAGKGRGLGALILCLTLPWWSLTSTVGTSDLPNNSRANAINIVLPPASAREIRGHIDAADQASGEVFDATDLGLVSLEYGYDDIEWFGKFTLESPDLIQASLLTLSPNADFDLLLLREDGRVIQSSASANNPEEWSPGIALGPGTYYIGISSYDIPPPSPASDFILTLARGGTRELLATDNGLAITRYFDSSPGRIVLNRFKPSKYPFRLDQVHIFFSRSSRFEPNPQGQRFRLLVLADPSGGALPLPLGQATLFVDQYVTVQATGIFNTYPVGPLPAITQGVIYIGYQVPAEVKPSTFSIWADAFGVDRDKSFTSEDGGLAWKAVPLHSFLVRGEGTLLAAQD